MTQKEPVQRYEAAMAQKSNYLIKQFSIWIFANILGLIALSVSTFLIPSLMFNSNIVVSTLMISIPFSLAQWLALRCILPISPLWILTFPIGWICSVFIFRAIPEWGVQILNEESILVLTTLYAVMGFAIGLPQWLILRTLIPNSSIWSLGSSFGIAGGFGLVLATGLINQSEIISYITVVLFYALITGLILVKLLASQEQHQYLRQSQGV